MTCCIYAPYVHIYLYDFICTCWTHPRTHAAGQVKPRRSVNVRNQQNSGELVSRIFGGFKNIKQQGVTDRQR
jgi:hypothetical protein